LAEEELFLRREGHSATVVINRPDQRNAITHDMWLRFPALLKEAEDEPDVRVVMITGAGDKAFSAGADIKDFEKTRSTPELSRNYRHGVEAACDALVGMTKPTMAVIRGYCIGGGFELSLHADLRVGDDTTKMGLPAAKRGIAIGHAFLSRLEHLAGAANTSYILLSARMLSAAESHNAGLLSSVVPAGALDDYVAKLVDDIADASPISHRIHKGVIEDLINYGSLDQVPDERRALTMTAEASEDFQEGVRSFMEKRKPRFSGR